MYVARVVYSARHLLERQKDNIIIMQIFSPEPTANTSNTEKLCNRSGLNKRNYIILREYSAEH